MDQIPNLLLQAQRKKNPNIKYENFKIDSQYFLPQYKNLSFYVRTYGCQANIVDSEFITYILVKLGFKPASDINYADLVILNTCAIRENAENKVYGEVGLLSKNKKKNPNFKLVVCGCMPQQEKTYVKTIKNYHIDLVFGTHNIYQLPKYLFDIYQSKKKIYAISHYTQHFFHYLPRSIDSKYKAFVTIMDGCDNFCTYCIVPYTRGQQISRNKEDILLEIRKLLDEGYVDITLIGQNVNAYGLDFKDSQYHFKDLLKDVAELMVPRIRFSTSNPWNFDPEIVSLMKQYPNIMPHIHLPIQSGDQEILKLMNRKTDLGQYRSLIKLMKTEIPQISITTDLIVGFPNESDQAFKNTLKLYKQVQYDNAFTFIFSPREGTPAAKMDDFIPYSTKQKRLAKLNALVRKYAKKINRHYLHKTVSVLVEGSSKTDPYKLTGYSEQEKVVNFTGIAKPGEIVNVKINKVNRFSLIGKQVK